MSDIVEKLRLRKCDYEALEAADEIESLRAQLAEAQKTIAFFACTIKSGEDWSDTCQSHLDAALSSKGEENDTNSDQ